MAASLGTPQTPPQTSPAESPFEKDDGHDLVYDLMRYTPVPTIILDASLHVRFVSDSYGLVSGAASTEGLVGQHAHQLFDQTSALHYFARPQELIHAAKDTGRQQQVRALGAGAVWNLRIIPIRRHDSLLSIHIEYMDITEEHRKQLELEERLYANETFKILVETVKDYAIFMLDPGGYIATWNAGAQAFKGYTKKEIVGKHFSSFYSQEDRDSGKPARELRDALRDGRCEDEGWRYRKDSSRFWANVVITPVYKDDVLLGFSKVTRDLTERRRAETTLIAAYEEASKLKTEFLQNMSHEIRTPMHGMLSALTLLLDTKLDPNQLELTQVIQESGAVLLQVINDILDYSKLASGSFSINNGIICVPDIVQSVFRANQACNGPTVKLESFLDPQLPRAAEGDSLRYRQIVQNLLSNALKFTEDGYVRIMARLDKEDEDFFTIVTEVVDTGIGVPASGANTLFTPFTQFDNSATKRYKGTGLGLSICKSLAELMGGTIGFHPNPGGRGSVFWFTAKFKRCRQITMLEALQQRPEANQVLTSRGENPMDQLKVAAVGQRVLLAEDNNINRKIMLKMLAGLGFDNIDTAIDGKDAVTKALRDPIPYDLILMDVSMPVQDGVSATKELRAKGITIPIIAMTANALKGQAESYIAKGMTGYIAKPVDRDLLVKLLLKCLKREGTG
ncbi:hypothetical protein NX059_002064 [Plenodomus lindquistii]|nr:hypothetical protein NX059_002064 [Plenodomus lindquistii]